MSETLFVQPEGRLDALGARGLWTELEALTRAENVRVLVDMTRTTYISSDGLRVLMRASKAAHRGGGKLVLCCLSARITEIVRLSKPGRREYTSASEIPVVKRGRGIVIISTSRGLMTGAQAKKQGVGGELICKVY